MGGHLAYRLPFRFGVVTLTQCPQAFVRAHIVDSWPEAVDDSRARRDWGWKNEYGFDRAFDEYLLPTIQKRYAQNAK